MFWIAHIRSLTVFFCLMYFHLSVFAINSPVYYKPSDNPPSSCMVFYFEGVLYFEGDNRSSRKCSGDIVGKDKLLTAGRCALKTGESAVVRCPDPDQRELLVKGQLVHSLYTKTEEISSFDHALFQMESDFFTFKPALLPQYDSEMLSLMGGECATFGYGLNSFENSGSLLGAPVFAALNSFLGFEMVATSGPAYIEEGDSGGGLFCRSDSHNKKGKWVRIATLSQTHNLNGERVTIAAPLSPVIGWIKRYLEAELPRVAGFRETPPLHTVPVEEMETQEDCLKRLVREAASDFTSKLKQISEAELKQVLAAEIAYQCNLKVSQEFLNPLFEEQKNRRKQAQQQQQQQPQLTDYVSYKVIRDYRKFIRRAIGHDMNRYCSDKNYKRTVCGICESDLVTCLSQEKHSKHKCEDFFEDCIYDAEEGIDEMPDAYERCDGEKYRDDMEDCIEDEIMIDRKLIRSLIDSYENKGSK